MIRLLTDGGRAALVAGAIAVALPGTTFAQRPAPAIESTPAVTRSAVANPKPTDNEDGRSVQIRRSVEPATPAAAVVDIQSRFNQLRRQLLDDRAAYIDRWLVVITIVLGFLAIVSVVFGYIGFGRFREIETQAKNSVQAANTHTEDARRYVEEIKEHRDTSLTILEGMNAQTVAEHPEEASQAVGGVKNSPGASLIDKAIAHAVFLQQQGKTEEATEKWRAIAKIVEGSDNDLAARAWFSVGYLVQDGRPVDSIFANDQAIRLRPDLAQAYSNRGVAKYGLERYESAIADYDEAIRLRPDLPEPYNNRGNAKYMLGRYEAAVIDYDQAIRMRPNNAEAYNNRGDTKAAMGQHEAAIADYDKAIRLKPDFAEVYDHRGASKHAMGQHEAAIGDYDEAIRLKPDFAEVYDHRGASKHAMGQHEAATGDYDEAIHLEPNSAESYDGRGNAKAAMGQHEEAIADYDKAIDLRPDGITAYNNRGNVRQAMGRYDDAMADYDEAIRLKPDYAEAYYNRGNAKRALGRYGDAVADYDKAIGLQPSYAEAYGNRGIAKAALGLTDEARKDLETVLELAEGAKNSEMVAEAEQRLRELGYTERS